MTLSTWWCVADRSHGNQYTQHIEDVHHSLDDYVTGLDNELSYRTRTIEELEQSELFYDIQYGEAKIVANVRSLSSRSPCACSATWVAPVRAPGL